MKPTIVFDNDKAYALVNGRVIASANDLGELEAKLASPVPGLPDQGGALGAPEVHPEQGALDLDAFPTDDPHPSAGPEAFIQNGVYLCGDCAQGQGDPYDGPREECSACGKVPGEEFGADPMAAPPGPSDDMGAMDPGDDLGGEQLRQGSTVTTPNGLKGRVLGKTKDLWGETVTVRFENGQIRQLPVTAGMKFEATEEPKIENPLEALEIVLEASVDGNRDSLEARKAALNGVKGQVRDLMLKGASFADSRKLDEMRRVADLELAEVDDALRHMDEATPYEMPQHQFPRVEQESIGGGDASWLDNVADDMIAEAEATDFDSLMTSGPEQFVAELDDAAVGNADATADMATSFVEARTAGTTAEARAEFHRVFLARVESCRRAEVRHRTTESAREAKQKRQTRQATNGPDDLLFL